ncbi:unnamed protein product [Moneuplotes crassus]|uniref:Uncharacterized protein n=1 Tax=Euplotes crassus TaxID=5936 RepID=A0AAD2CZC9_EUPCR|nr:unnamed protein product [Moneuplotes crassus]
MHNREQQDLGYPNAQPAGYPAGYQPQVDVGYQQQVNVGGQQQVNGGGQPSYELAVARDDRKSKNFGIKVIAWILMVLGGISLIVNIFQFISAFVNLGNQRHGSGNTLMTEGFPGLFGKAIDVIASGLVVYQGYLTLKTAKEDQSEATKKMLKYIIYFAVAHLTLRIIQMIVILVLLVPLTQGQQVDVDEENKVNLTTVLFTVMGFTVICTCCCLLCYCGGIYAYHRSYKKSQERYEMLERSVNQNTNAPKMDYGHMQNQMV